MVFRALASVLVLTLSAAQAQGQDPSQAPDPAQLEEISVLAPRLMEPHRIASRPREDGSRRLEEVTVRGQRSLAGFRLEAVAARERIWDVFNEINDDDRFDISCSREGRTGTRITRRVCRPGYAADATSEAGKEFARYAGLCSPEDAACLEAAYAAGTLAAQRYIAEIAHMDQRLDEEAQRLARENVQFALAILDYQQKQREYEEARRRR